MRSQNPHIKHSNKTSQRICKNLYSKVFKTILIPFHYESLKDQKKLQSKEGRKEALKSFMYKSFESLNFNSYQMAVTVYYSDLFLSEFSNRGFKFSYIFLKSILIVSMITCHKITCDVCYSNSSLQEYFNVDNLAELEAEYYGMVDFKINFPLDKVFEYLDLLLE